MLHGNNRFGNIEVCASCHNPLNTDKRVRDVAQQPPSDGKDEESINFTTMVHAIHAPSIRDNPLEVVGFRGFSTHVYDEDHVQYPGDLADCTSCHGDEGYQLPLASGVLGTTIDTGADILDPADDVVDFAAVSRLLQLPRERHLQGAHGAERRQLQHHPGRAGCRRGAGDLRSLPRQRPQLRCGAGARVARLVAETKKGR